jgi:SAM-dependent methyltransferase
MLLVQEPSGRTASQITCAASCRARTFRRPDLEPDGYIDRRFSVVVTRHTFHHLLAPARALAEMLRVCRPDGWVAVVDAAVPVEKAAAHDALERIRDPSQVHALSPGELLAMAERAGLADLQTASYRLPFRLEQTLTASFPEAGGSGPRRWSRGTSGQTGSASKPGGRRTARSIFGCRARSWLGGGPD